MNNMDKRVEAAFSILEGLCVAFIPNAEVKRKIKEAIIAADAVLAESEGE